MTLGNMVELEKQLRYDNLYLDIAARIAQMSHARRLKVGVVLVKNDAIIAQGWNGTPKGFDNNCEDEIDSVLVTKDEVLHAEYNCLCKICKNTMSSEAATMYLTCNPCMGCSKLIYQAGIVRIVFRDYYRETNGLDFLKKCGVEICHIPLTK